MNWILALLFLVCAGLLWRIYSDVRKGKEKKVKDWDETLIERLRKSGSDPFQPHDVDFFMAMPSEAAGQAVSVILQAEGYRVDLHAAPDNPADHPFSLHATKSLRLSVPGMKELSAHFKELAKTHGGHYDGWSAAVVPQVTPRF